LSDDGDVYTDPVYENRRVLSGRIDESNAVSVFDVFGFTVPDSVLYTQLGYWLFG
jgi:hypothetical protein